MADGRERTRLNLTVDPDSALQRSLRVEQDESRQFEKMLQDALNDELVDLPTPTVPKLLGRTPATNPSSEFDRLYDREYVPVISYLSPTLGRMASPLTVSTRLEMISTGKSPKHSRRQTSLKRKADGRGDYDHADKSMMTKTPSKTVSKTRIGSMVEELKVKVKKDIDDSEDFERRLEEALRDEFMK